MEATFVRLESLTYFSLTPIPLFGSGYAGLGDMTPIHPAAMANIMGDLWQNGTPQWEKALKYSGVRLHLYGKQDPRPARKMGHLTATAKTAQQAVETVLNARNGLSH